MAIAGSMLLAGCLPVAAGDVTSPEQPEATGSVAREPAENGGDLIAVVSLEIAHDYFADGMCSTCVLVPSAETASLLRQAGAFFRFQDGRAVILAPANVEFGTGRSLELTLSTSDVEFSVYTAMDTDAPSAENDAYSLTSSPAPPGLATIAVSVAALPVEARIDLAAPRVFWRWTIIGDPQDGSFEDWRLVRANAPDVTVDQDPPVAVDVNGFPGWQFNLREPLPLRQSPPDEHFFVLIPPSGTTESDPIRLPTAGVASIRSMAPGAPMHADMFVRR